MNFIGIIDHIPADLMVDIALNRAFCPLLASPILLRFSEIVTLFAASFNLGHSRKISIRGGGVLLRRCTPVNAALENAPSTGIWMIYFLEWPYCQYLICYQSAMHEPGGAVYV